MYKLLSELYILVAFWKGTATVAVIVPFFLRVYAVTFCPPSANVARFVPRFVLVSPVSSRVEIVSSSWHLQHVLCLDEAFIAHAFTQKMDTFSILWETDIVSAYSSSWANILTSFIRLVLHLLTLITCINIKSAL